MADKAITELVAAEDINESDLFVLQQNNTAKKLPGQVLLNWLTKAAGGHGGIKSIEKLRTNILADTYRITLADTTTFDFVVNNGRGINSIKKSSTSGLVDTYRISYNDNTTSTFSVTNGAKGDKGDNSYIWIKYASQEPTASSHSFGDLPDAWIGVYFGTASTAPTDWQQYRWFPWKGEKGDTGDPATLVSSKVTYQVGASGTIIPSGSWSSSVPSVAPGRYLWTRQVIQFNTGTPITTYSVSRFGIDGSGAVSTVAGVVPDANGNVPLDASSVNALPTAGGTMQGPIDMNGQKLSGLNAPTADNDAATKGFVTESVKDKVNKTNVVNNFVTTAEGYVADARALKVLNDNKTSIELVWENKLPENELGQYTYDIPELGDATFLDIELRLSTTNSYTVTQRVRVGRAVNCMSDNNNGKLSTRVISTTKDAMTVGDGYAYNTYGSYAPNNAVLIPVRAYAIRGG